ncbi:MAG TPA: DUF4349 domain-containing protein, partial [Candidatus Nanoarchaeia archaeon]|nr:DUF4349 domain-containing protein [Candidatus Nanoarchaeia archaeon]
CSGPLTSLNFGKSFSSSTQDIQSEYSGGGSGMSLPSSSYGRTSEYYTPPSYGHQDFAPEVADRKIAKTVQMSNQVERGDFDNADAQVKSVVQSSGAFMLNQNIQELGSTGHKYKTGSYQIKVDASKYDSMVALLKQVGKVTSFRETASDITGQYANLQIDIETEKARLKRYNDLFAQATIFQDKLTLNDRIFNQERQIKYMEDRMVNVGQQVEYSTITFSLNEKQSDYADIVFVKLSKLVKGLVSSTNALLMLFVYLLPFAIAAAILWGVYRFIKR